MDNGLFQNVYLYQLNKTKMQMKWFHTEKQKIVLQYR